MRWKDIPDYEGLYEINEHGEIRGKNRIVKRKDGKTNKYKQQVIKPYLSNGYKRVCLTKNNIRKQYLVHRLVAITFIKNKENKELINHKDANKLNNHIDNLEWCTYKENNNHARNLKLYPILKSEKSPKSKLCLNDVLNIRKYCSNNIKERKEFAKKYNVSQRTIYDVLVFRTWKECDSYEG